MQEDYIIEMAINKRRLKTQLEMVRFNIFVLALFKGKIKIKTYFNI